MSNPFKQLAGETAIYGMSTILARIVNFLLVPLYTRVLIKSDYGVVTEFMAYIAIFQVILSLGLETGCFRFASKEGTKQKEVFSNAFVTVFALGVAFFSLLLVFSDPISTGLGYEGFSNVIIYVGAILAIDSCSAILFAKQRYEHKAVKFAVIKTLKIFTEIGVNLVLYLSMPSYFATHSQSWLLKFVSATPDFSYAIFAVFVSCLLCLVLLIPDLIKLTFKFDKKLWKSLMIYSLPLMVAGLPGVMNDFLDRILMRFINVDTIMWRADLGEYQAGVKIAVIMSLFIQMFRYAAEPFFFQRQKQSDSRIIYAKVMNYFVAFCMFVFLAVILYIDVIGLILGKNFRAGLSIAPIMLMAYVVLGMLFNINMWYKLSGMTKYAIYITLSGLVVTIVINLIFMPLYSYHAAAWAHLASYLVMFLFSLFLGRKYFPISYEWDKILIFIVLGLSIYGISLLLPDMGLWLKMAVHSLLIMVYLGTVLAMFKAEKKREALCGSEKEKDI